MKFPAGFLAALNRHSDGGHVLTATTEYEYAGVVHRDEYVIREWIEDGNNSGWAIVHHTTDDDGNDIATIIDPREYTEGDDK